MGSPRRSTSSAAGNDDLLTVPGDQGVPLSVAVKLAERGTRASIPVLLVHGFGASGRSNWAATGWLAGLHRARISTVTVDLRGSGRSGKPLVSTAYSLSILLADLRAVLATVPDVLGPLPLVDLIGYSLGGRLVGELAAASGRSSAQPDSARLQSAPSGSIWPDRTLWPEGLPTVRRVVIGGYDGRPLFEDLDDIQFAAFREAIAGRPARDGIGRRTAAIALADRNNDLAALSAMVAGLRGDPRPLPAAAVDVPTLVVAGESDAITADTLRWAADLPSGRHLSIPGRNHISTITSAVFRTAAVDFLAN